VRDFGSRNGTYLNGQKIGQREKNQSPEEGQKNRFNEFDIKSGDRLRLGRDCEIEVKIILPQSCVVCFNEIDKVSYKNAANLPVCPECYSKKQNKSNGKIKCVICKKELFRTIDNSDICSECKQNPRKILDYLIRKAEDDSGDLNYIAGYRIIKSLGHGGMGEVWQVEEEKTGKQMALKVMLPKVAVNEKSRKMFLRESQIGEQLIYKHIVHQFKSGKSSDNIYFILMELCGVGSLDKLIAKKGGKLDIKSATNIMLQILDGLNYAHNAKINVKLKDGTNQTVNGVIHRDLKPHNIFLTGDKNNPIVKIADFGLAKAFEISGQSGFTRTGQASGTPVFMPRQQIKDYKYSKPDVDVWAAAATYYYMLTGFPPKEFKGFDMYLDAFINSAVPIRQRNADIPSRLAKVIDYALIDDLEKGIGVKTAAELKKLIENAL
jgi:serine/threonine-protein kinase